MNTKIIKVAQYGYKDKQIHKQNEIEDLKQKQTHKIDFFRKVELNSTANRKSEYPH